MTSKVPYQPNGYQSVIPYIHAQDATGLISFIREVFNAEEIAIYRRPDGTVGHAAFRIGDSDGQQRSRQRTGCGAFGR